MHLEALHVEKYRSIDSADLSGCGQFNVLIGKNNAGKSALLTAIDLSFAMIRKGQVVDVSPSFGKEIDYFQGSEGPIGFTLLFILTATERDQLVRDIVTESPQMKNAADGLSQSLRLSLSIRAQKNLRFAVISRISLVADDGLGNRSERQILGIDLPAAIELHKKFQNSQSNRNVAQRLLRFVKQLDDDDWRRFKREDSMPISRYLMARSEGALPQEVVGQFETLFRRSATLKELHRSIEDLATEAETAAETAEKSPLSNRVSTFSGEADQIPLYVSNLLARMSQIRVLHLQERRKQIGREEAQRLLDLKTRRGGEKTLESVKDTVLSLLGVRIDAFQGSSSEPEAELDVDNFLVEANGSGIREALRLLLDVEFARPDVLLVEEPEVHLHPALETSMMRHLKRLSQATQIFITTHSTNFLDTADVRNVYMVKKDNSTTVRLLDVDSARAEIPKELGIRLSSLFMFDRLVFVEGKSDEGALREWAATLKVNLSQVNVGFVAMEGVRNITHYATEKTLSFLSSRQVRIWFIIDRDERDGEEIARLQELLGSRAELKILRRREIENYMLSPRVLCQFMRSRRKGAGESDPTGLPSEEELRKKIYEAADALKQLAIDKRIARQVCKPLYPDTRAIFESGKRVTDAVRDEMARLASKAVELGEKLAQVEAEQTKAVNDSWEANRLDIVPGTELLDRVLQGYGLRFHKDRDCAILAATMQEAEIDEEIRAILANIGAC